MGNNFGNYAEKDVTVLSPTQQEMGIEDGVEDESPKWSPRSASLTSLWWIVLCSSMLIAIMQAALDSTITADLQPAIIDTFGEISKFPWINLTYPFGQGGSCLLWGKLLSIIDNKKILLVGRLLFAIGCTLTAAAPSMNAFIVGKTLLGVGGCSSYISIIYIIITLTSAQEQGQYFGYLGFVWGLGPPIGGVFAATTGDWRWSFYFNLMLVAITFPIFLFVLPSREVPNNTFNFRARLRCIDILESVLFIGALCFGIMAVSFGGALYSWGSVVVIEIFCYSGVIWATFVIQQITATLTTEANRVLPLHILHSWEMWILIFQIGCSTNILFIIIYYIPLYFQFIRGETALRSAVDLLPSLFTVVFAMLFSGRLITIFGCYKIWFIAGSGLALMMSACLYFTKIDTSHGKIYGYLILGGVGTGLYAMNAGPVMSAIVAKEHTADASTIFGCVDSLSGAFSVAIANSVFINRATDSIQKILPDTPRAAVQEAIAGTGASLTNELPPALRKAVLQATLDAIQKACIHMIATAAQSFVLSFFLRNRKLSELSKRWLVCQHRV